MEDISQNCFPLAWNIYLTLFSLSTDHIHHTNVSTFNLHKQYPKLVKLWKHC